MVDPSEMKVGDEFTKTERKSSMKGIKTKDKDGNEYTVHKNVWLELEVSVKIVDKVTESRESGSNCRWFKVEETTPAHKIFRQEFPFGNVVGEVKPKKSFSFCVSEESEYWLKLKKVRATP